MAWLSSREIEALKVGARVHVEIDGTVVALPGALGWLKVQDENGITHHIWLSGEDSNPKIALTAPDFWPPRKGDTWEAKGTQYFCHMVATGIFSMMLVSPDGNMFDNDDGFAAFLALGPRLVRRNQ